MPKSSYANKVESWETFVWPLKGEQLMVITQVSSGLRKITIIISKLIQVSSC